jgi:hypothetical protein
MALALYYHNHVSLCYSAAPSFETSRTIKNCEIPTGRTYRPSSSKRFTYSVHCWLSHRCMHLDKLAPILQITGGQPIFFIKGAIGPLQV